jgi:hypothetical protein
MRTICAGLALTFAARPPFAQVAFSAVAMQRVHHALNKRRKRRADMKRTTIATVLATVIASGSAGCMPSGDTVAWYRANTTRVEATADTHDCIIEATQQIPSAMGINSNPGYQSPGTTVCNGFSNSVTCNQIGGVNIAPSVSSYDANLSVKKMYAERCLARKGYRLQKMKSANEHTGL